MNFHNLPLEEISGNENLSAGEVIVLKTFGRPVSLQIITSSDEYKITDTSLDDPLIYAQSDDATDGWNTVFGDTWKDESDVILWDGVTAAIRIVARDTNTGSISVSWEIDV